MKNMLLLLLPLGFALAQKNPTQVDLCSCGYYDAKTGRAFTESIIFYFNETTHLSQDVWLVQEYVKKKQKGFNAVYRQGARSENVGVGNDSTVWLQDEVNPNSLELYVDPATEDHLVVGAEVNSLRQDIKYGSFRARMRSSHPWAGGSALSMMVMSDETQSLELDMLNADHANDARLTYMVNAKYLDQQPSTNDLDESTSPISPWEFMDTRIDWAEDAVNFTVANTITRAITSKDHEIPQNPSEVVLKHWSTGDANFMQGPPTNRSAANIAWLRLFFNSSLMTAENHRRYDADCTREQVCDMDDITLRGSSSYTQGALKPYKKPARNITLRIPAAIVAAVGAFFGFVTLTNALISRGPWGAFARLFKRKRPESLAKKPADTPVGSSNASTILRPGFQCGPGSSAGEETSRGVSVYSQSNADPFDSQGPTRRASEIDINMNLALMKEETSSIAEQRASFTKRPISLGDRRASILSERQASIADRKAYLKRHRLSLSERIGHVVDRKASQFTERRMSSKEQRASIEEGKASLEDQVMKELIARVETQERSRSSVADHPFLGPQKPHSLGAMASHAVEEEDVADELSFEKTPKSFEITDITTKASVPHRRESAGSALCKIEQPSLTNPDSTLRQAITPITPSKQRVDYLAGLVALSCMAVTFVHFALTFVPFVAGLGSGQHYSYEEWARRIVGPYILTPIWIGPFFTTSARWLAQRYLTDGQLSEIAKKMLLRAPRMLIPVIILAMLQYFLIDQGTTASLEYLPAISWSTWPYVTKYPHFGYFINYMIELAFLVPNAAPQVVSHYCVGVLWIIPVQLQNSYLILLAVVMIKDIRTPWKRFAFYTFCILNHWYMFSWGACFWLGLVLVDLDVTYKWIKWIQARPLVHYPFLILMWIIAITAPTFYLISDHLDYPLMTVEKGWHPDPETGLPMGQTPRAGYPYYYDPRLNTLLFAGALQVIVEISTWVQWFLSLPVFIWLFPHVMTIYLIHGFVFWSLGAWLCVTVDRFDVPYWANLLIVGVVCYAVLLLTSVFITFVTETTARAVCGNTWRWASEEPVAKLPTLFPFPKDQFLNRIRDDGSVGGDGEKMLREDVEGKEKCKRDEDEDDGDTMEKDGENGVAIV